MSVRRIGDGCYRVTPDGGDADGAARGEVVYVAGPVGRRWAWWNGRVYREADSAAGPAARASRPGVALPITAPMPATVLKVLVAPGAQVTKGDTLVIVEAMKMELPLRATEDARVVSVACKEGDLVQPDTVLVELA